MNERAAVVGPCKCGGYGIVYDEQAEVEMGKCHGGIDDHQLSAAAADVLWERLEDGRKSCEQFQGEYWKGRADAFGLAQEWLRAALAEKKGEL